MARGAGGPTTGGARSDPQPQPLEEPPCEPVVDNFPAPALDRARLPEVLTVAEAAVALDRCPHWVRQQIAAGRLRAARPGGRGGWLVRREWLFAYLDACSSGGPSAWGT